MDAFLANQELKKRCDILVLAYENERDSKQFLDTRKDSLSVLLPRILVNLKSQRIPASDAMTTQSYAETFGIKVWKELLIQPD